METSGLRGTCPVCGRSDISSISSHLYTHSKQALVDWLVLQQEQGLLNSGSFQRGEEEPEEKPGFPEVVDPLGGIEEPRLITTLLPPHHRATSGGVPTPKKSNSGLAGHSRPPQSRRKSQGRSSSQQQLLTHEGPQQITGDTDHDMTTGSLVYDLEVRGQSTSALQIIEPHVYESGSSGGRGKKRGPKPKSSRASYGQNDHPSTSGSTASQSHIIKPRSPDSPVLTHVINEAGENKTTIIKRSQQQETWVVDGDPIHIYEISNSEFTGVEEPEPLPFGPTGKVENVSGRRPDGYNIIPHADLMTDEEIPPRGEISEYEESNTSSFLSDEPNGKQSMGGTAGSSLGSMWSPFMDVRRRSPVVDFDSGSSHSKRSKVKTPKAKISTGSKKSIKVAKDGHKCSDCVQEQYFSSIFELAQHQEEVHHKKFKSITPGAQHQQSSQWEQTHGVLGLNWSSDLKPEAPRLEPSAEPIPGEPPIIKKEPGTVTTTAVKREHFCIYCDFVTTGRKALKDHNHVFHPQKNPMEPSRFECMTCGKMFKARMNLIKHILVHRRKTHVCTYCNKGYTSRFKLMEHTRVHTKEYPFSCKVCSKSFRTTTCQRAHTLKVHGPPRPKPVRPRMELLCNICHRILHSNRSFKAHKLRHATQDNKIMRCRFCSDAFNRISVMIRHIRLCHDPLYETKECKPCPVCEKKLHPNSLKTHMRIHCGERPFSCVVCSKTFRTQANLQSHSWNHTNAEKPYKCKSCPKSYLFRKTLENHTLVHKKNRLYFSCNECGMKFTSKVNMKRHVEEHYSEKKHKCKTCGKAFHRGYYLKEHERIHTELKPFTCTICGKASSTRSNHKAHIKIHDARDTGTGEG